jgi:hypothetical protein
MKPGVLFTKLGKGVSLQRIKMSTISSSGMHALIIQELQDDLGLDVSSLPDVEMTALKFYAAKASKSLQTRKAENEGKSRHNDDNNCTSGGRTFN